MRGIGSETAGVGYGRVGTGKLCARRSFANDGCKILPLREIRSECRTGNARRGLVNGRIDHVTGTRMEATHVGLIADGEAVELGAIFPPNIADDLGVVFGEIRICASADVQKAH